MGGAPPSGPSPGSSPNAGDAHEAGRLSRRQAVTLVTAEALHWEGCRRPRGMQVMSRSGAADAAAL